MGTDMKRRPAARLVRGYDITATDKRHISGMIALDVREASSKRKSYSIQSIDSNRVELVICRSDRDGMERHFMRRQSIRVEVAGKK